MKQFLRAQDPFVPGWISVEEGIYLLETCMLLPRDSMAVELGAFCGKSTRWLYAGCMYERALLYSIDLFTGEFPGEPGKDDNAYYANLLNGNCFPCWKQTMFSAFPYDDLDKSLPLIGDHFTFAKNWHRGKIDLLFEDADHSKCRQSIEAWYPHLSDHAVIIFDDVATDPRWGIDNPFNTFRSLLEQGWKYYGGVGKIQAITRDTEFWRTRAEAVSDQFTRGPKNYENREPVSGSNAKEAGPNVGPASP